MTDRPISGLGKRLLQLIALYAPGATTTRVRLHRMRGVRIGRGCFIGTAVLIETSVPDLISIGDNVTIGIRAIIIAHAPMAPLPDPHGGELAVSVRIEDDAFIGPGVIVLPNVTIGKGAVVTAGSVVTSSVQAMTMVRGNPAVAIAHCEVPLGNAPYKEFIRHVRPIRPKAG